jgi:hypothetical protein
MRTAWIALLLGACGAREAPARVAGAETQGEETAEAAPTRATNDCPPAPCAGPEPTPEALLVRATSIARQRMWQDTGGDGDEPSTPTPTAEWAHAPFAVIDAVADQLGAITVSRVQTTRRPGAAAFLAMHREDGWYACMVTGRAGTHAAYDVLVEEAPAATPLFEEGPRGLTMRARFDEVWSDDGMEYVSWEVHVGVCGVERVPGCYGTIQLESGGSESDGERGTERSYENVEIRFDGAGTVFVRPAWGEESVPEGEPSVLDQVGARAVRNLRCNLRAR